MRRHGVGIAAVLVALVAVLGAAVAPAPAGAAAHRRMIFHVIYEANGGFAWRDANNGGAGSNITEGAKGVFGPATDIQWFSLGTTSDYDGVTRVNGRIFLNEHPDLCVGSVAGSLTAQNCERGPGTVYALVEQSGGNAKFESRLFSNSTNGPSYVAGRNNGGQLVILPSGNGFALMTPGSVQQP